MLSGSNLIMSTVATSHRLTMLLVSFVICSPICWAADEELLRVMTFNVRYGSAPDKENSWPLRREMVLSLVGDSACDVIGLQEALQFQIDELTTAFPCYSSLGVGREADGGGEYSAILYDGSRFDVRQASTFWLSETPERSGSRSWGNELPRICTWARLFDRKNKQTFYVFNTHWDHQSQKSREHSGLLISDRIANLKNQDAPVILLGDFNVGHRNPAWTHLMNAGLRDSFRDLSADATGIGTFHAFQGSIQGEKIDAILVSSHWQVEAAGINRTNAAGRYPSDHFPVTATLLLKERE